MSSHLDYPDNLVICLGRGRRHIKCFTTDSRDKFKMIIGLSDMDGVIETKYINLRELKQLVIDSVINEFSLKENLIFRQGVHGLALELAKEREDTIKEQELHVVPAEVIDD